MIFPLATVCVALLVSAGRLVTRGFRPSRRSRGGLPRIALLTLAAVATLPLRAATFDLSTATVADINAAFEAGALTSEKLTGLYLARIAAYDRHGPKINAVITPNPRALDEARALDAERKAKGPRSALHGIPVVVKDLVDVAGLPTTAGFTPFGAPIPLRDATIVARLKAAGAIILAKVATVNWFGLGFDDTHPIGVTLNPYSLAHTTGGSSNGSGAAMAAWFAAVAIGTDTGGSVVIPSSYCSLAGMVATQGLVSRAGIVPRGATQDRAGPMGRHVADLAVLLAVIGGWDAEDYATSAGVGHFPKPTWAAAVTTATLKGKRIGVLREMLRDGAPHAEGLALFERALDDMRQAGASIVDPVLTGLDLKTETTSAAGRTAEFEKIGVQNAYLARLGSAAKFKTIEEMIAQVGREKFSRLMLDALTLPSPGDSPEYEARLRQRTVLRELIQNTVDRFSLDALVFPFSTLPPSPLAGAGGRGSGGGGGNSLASNNGLPSVLVPGGYTQDGLPISIQFVGKPFADFELLKVAAGYERASQRRIPPATTPPLPGERFTYDSPPPTPAD